MAFDFNQLKQRFLTRGAKQEPATTEQPMQAATTPEASPAPAQKMTATQAKVQELKQGFADIKAVCDEGNYKLFVKQLVLVLCVFLGVRFLLGKLTAQKEQILDRVSAIAIQQTNQGDYLANKDLLLHLEPLFPDLSKKNEWLVQTLMKAFSDHLIQADINGNTVEKSEENYTALSQDVTFKLSFADLGKFLADLENGDDFLRISNVTLSKLTDPALLGSNSINLKINTLFPKEKFAKRIFKDYDAQMKKIAAENAPAAPKKQAEAPAPAEQAAQPQEATKAEENANAK